MSALLHGGVAGLQPGDLVLPASKTGAFCHTRSPEKPTYTPDRVYVTIGLDYAQCFAYLRDGAVYEVRPLSPLRPDPDSRVAPSWSCRKALVVRVVVPAPAPMPEAVYPHMREALRAYKDATPTPSTT